MAIPKLSTGAIIAIVAAGLFLTLVTAGTVVNQTVPSTGTITAVNVGVYSNSQCTQNITAINWGTISADSSTTENVYIKNTGNVPITLTMTTASWSPSNANSYLTLTWNRQGTILNAGQSISATLTLTTATDTGSLTDFSFNIIITGTE